MARQRLGVALLFNQEVADEIDSLRELFDDPSLGRIAPHITLVPPVNVRGNQLQKAVEVLMTAARESKSFALSIGPVSTFFPVSAVLKADVSGAGVADLLALRDRVSVEPLKRKLEREFVPHVTIASEIDEERAIRAVRDYAGFHIDVEIHAVTLLQETPGRQWQIVAEFPLGVL